MKSGFWKALGPGIIWAGAAVGVSHLVQSTRAGAGYGFELVWLILVINLLKYPFFEFGPRYAIASGKTLIHGYLLTGKWAVFLFFFLTIGTMFTLQAAVSAVTVGILGSIFPGFLGHTAWIILLFAVCLLIIVIGRYKALDYLMKMIIVVLSVSTIIAVIAGAGKGYHPQPGFAQSFSWSATDVAFMIALAGWMPSAIDISVWHSMWTLEKARQSGYRPTLRQGLTDFRIGYFGTVILAIAFLSLGALTMYGTGMEFARDGASYASQLLEIYTSTIGPWAYTAIAIAAATTMFSTTLTVMDAYPRVLKPVSLILAPSLQKLENNKYLEYFWIGLLLTGSFLVMTAFSKEMKLLVDIATTLSFITAPVLGYLNYKAVTADHIDPRFRPGKGLRWLSQAGLIILSVFAIYFLITLFI